MYLMNLFMFGVKVYIFIFFKFTLNCLYFNKFNFKMPIQKLICEEFLRRYAEVLIGLPNFNTTE